MASSTEGITAMDLNMRTYRKILIWIPVFFWMVFIFYMSDQPGGISNDLSTDFSRLIAEIAEKIGVIEPDTAKDELFLNNLNAYIRQFAHGFSYFMLALISIVTYRAAGRTYRAAVPLVLLLCVIHALMDEIHQYFVPGRATEFYDILTDTCGALTAVVLYGCFAQLRILLKGRRHANPNN